MIPTKQTILGKGGNCFCACIASILEVPIETVPDFGQNPNWREETNKWLAQHNMFYIDVMLPGDMRDELVDFWGYHVIAGKGPRGMQHAVVGYKGEMVFDPHPSGDGLLPDQELEYGLFVNKLEGSK